MSGSLLPATRIFAKRFRRTTSGKTSTTGWVSFQSSSPPCGRGMRMWYFWQSTFSRQPAVLRDFTTAVFRRFWTIRGPGMSGNYRMSFSGLFSSPAVSQSSRSTSFLKTGLQTGREKKFRGNGSYHPVGDGEFPTLQEMEKKHIQRALDVSRGKIYGPGGAAELLGMKPTTLQSRMKKTGAAVAP